MAKYVIKVVEKNRSYLFPTNENPNKYDLAEIDEITSVKTDRQEFAADHIKSWLPVMDLYLIKHAEIHEQYPQKYQIAYNNSSIYEYSQMVKKESSTFSYSSISSDVGEIIELLKDDEDALNHFLDDYYISYYLRNIIREFIYLSKQDSLPSEEQEKKNQIEKDLREQICSYSNLRNVIIWQQKYFKNMEEKEQEEQKLDALRMDYYNQLAQNSENQMFSSEEYSNKRLQELMEKYDDDLEMVIEVVGTDFMDNLSDEDQQLSGYTDYKRRGR